MRFWPRSKKPVVPVVRLHGVIGQGSSLRPGLSLAGIESALDKAFRTKGPAVALVINSPGGSPVQSSLIVQRIRALADKHDKATLAFVEDVAASGGYWLATAADEIVVDESSILGSIGVVTATFGFPELLAKIGVERRVYTIGENKAILDPFRPQREADVEILHAVQADVHAAFVASVKARRGTRLGDDPDLFTGRFWSGRAAVDLGLADSIGEIRTTLESRFGEKVRIKSVPTSRPSLLRRLGLASAPSAEALLGAAHAHLLWDRYGA
ncbi:S49 family peptidase [Acuticoccus sp. I52.16.1]|uniref:S49 family peptidase n=1 Tax=Acuticoccus sp. I52.16.1 TaxID=2928472 RepID=UPI001FD6120A|nr:S49 family peptidase [Acuticoccus sp. I52.16.1]UOM34651.1 S49 family peptidase [Acuticoccus sp. I52.16.1]